MHDLQALLDEIGQGINANDDRGRIAEHISELAKQDSGKFGKAIATVDGEIFPTGD